MGQGLGTGGNLEQDEQGVWAITVGRAGFIIDNLLAAKQARPMLIVMPNGSLPRAATRPQAATNEASAADIAARRAAARDRFTNELLNDIVPFVEKSLRVQADPAGRAVAGLSMGGGQTLRVITKHASTFAHAAIWSAGLRRDADQFAIALLAAHPIWLPKAPAEIRTTARPVTSKNVPPSYARWLWKIARAN